MNLKNIDLNLLVYLDVLLRKRNVTRSAEFLGISQPAMSNGLQRLRKLFNDPLLVRTGNGMSPTERAARLQPLVRQIVSSVEKAVESEKEFDPAQTDRVFRISVSDKHCVSGPGDEAKRCDLMSVGPTQWIVGQEQAASVNRSWIWIVELHEVVIS